MKSIGILGGSFNPIHNGHLTLAQSVLENLDLDKIIFIPTGHSPFKDKVSKKNKKERLKMLELAIEGNDNFEINESEIFSHGKSYTYNTLKKLTKNSKDKFYFIIGVDLLNDIEKWYKIKDLFKLVTFVVVNRFGDDHKYLEIIKNLRKKYNANIIFCKIPTIEISSTKIRNRIIQNKSLDYYLPCKVNKHIMKNDLYKETNKEKNQFEHYKKELEKSLKPNRYEHSLNVMKTAIELAEKYNVDIKKARIAGLMHDCAKSMTKEEMLKLAKSMNFKIPNDYRNNVGTLHAIIGPLLAKKKFGINDEEILSAIAKHTTGSNEMSKLDKIIFLADYIEPNRTQPGVDEVRELAEIDLDLAVLKSLENTINYLKENNKLINSDSLKAYEALKEKYERV